MFGLAMGHRARPQPESGGTWSGLFAFKLVKRERFIISKLKGRVIKFF